MLFQEKLLGPSILIHIENEKHRQKEERRQQALKRLAWASLLISQKNPILPFMSFDIAELVGEQIKMTTPNSPPAHFSPT